MIVKNEDQFIEYALLSVLPYVTNAIIYDTGSEDNTVSCIKNQIASIREVNPNIKITFEEYTLHKPEEITELRYKQLKETSTDWFILVDGDEIWPQKQLFTLLTVINTLPEEIVAVVNRTRNCVGDIRHYMYESMGRYTFLEKTGNYNIRLMKNMPYELRGRYPDEAYYLKGKPIASSDTALFFSDAWYLHATHLKRSSIKSTVFGRRKPIYTRGIYMTQQELPESMQDTDWKPRGVTYELKAFMYDLVRKTIL